MSYALTTETPIDTGRRMPSSSTAEGASRGRRFSTLQTRTGVFLSGLAVLFLLLDGSMKVLRVQAAVEGTMQLGYPAGVLVPLGVLQLILVVLYLIPRLSPLGAILWTGYLGGAIATHVRLGNPLFTHVLFPIYVAALLWAGLWLRDARVRGLLERRVR